MLRGYTADVIIVDEFANSKDITDKMIEDATTKSILDNRTIINQQESRTTR